jgi:hypothetical protein
MQPIIQGVTMNQSPETTTPATADDKGKPPHEFHIQIDRTPYTTTHEQLTGAQLRQIAQPPIGSDRDLFEVVPSAPDRKISDTDTVEIHDGQRFFTAPSKINPG